MNKLQEKQFLKAQEFAKSKNGKLLSIEYINSIEKLKWQCTCGHEFFSSYDTVVYKKRWCSKCSINKQKISNGLENAKNKALLMEGFCLSTEYTNRNIKMIWKCSNPNHKPWKASYSSIMAGTWCPYCAYEKRVNSTGLIKAKEYAKKMGGHCLSTEYISSNQKMIWKCSNINHKSWTAKYNSVVNTGNWCLECANENNGNRLRNLNALEQAKEHAKKMGGQCLSTEYKNSKVKMLWKCSNINHDVWSNCFDSVIRGSWCPICLKERLANKYKNKSGLEDAKKSAQKLGGECLSTEYTNRKIKMLWKCSNPKHKPWKASYSSIMAGSWCPYCSNNFVSEKRVRLIFERFFNEQFPPTRAKWNINPKTNHKLELDGYCEKLKIAFEHDGEHHIKNVSYNKKHKQTNDLIYQKYKDEQKKKNCKNNGVLLINVPIITSTTERNKFGSFLQNVIDSCKKVNLNIIFTNEQLKILEKDFYLV